MTPDAEPYVSPEVALNFVPVTRRRLLALARRGIPGSYTLDPTAKRRRWMFKVSELLAAFSKTAIPKSRKLCDPALDLGGSR